MYAHRDSRNGERFIPLSKRRVYFYDQKQSAMAVTRQIRRGGFVFIELIYLFMSLTFVKL